MSKKIIISTVCFCCGFRDEAVKAVMPSRLSKGAFDHACIKCESINTYRLSIKDQQIKVETVHVMSTEKGREKYKERTGEDLEKPR